MQSKAGPSLFGFPPDLPMPYLPQHPTHHGVIPPCIPNMGSSPDLLRRTINSQLTSLVGGFKEPVQVFFLMYPELNYHACLGNYLSDVMHNISPALGINSLEHAYSHCILCLVMFQRNGCWHKSSSRQDAFVLRLQCFYDHIVIWHEYGFCSYRMYGRTSSTMSFQGTSTLLPLPVAKMSMVLFVQVSP